MTAAKAGALERLERAPKHDHSALTRSGRVVAAYLRDCGYRVIEAGTADEAVSVLFSQRAVDIVFSNVQMPGELDGFGLAQWVRQHRPRLKVILTSGHRQSGRGSWRAVL